MRGIKTVRKKQGVIIHCILKVATMMSKENEAQLQLEPKGLVFGCLQRPPYFVLNISLQEAFFHFLSSNILKQYLCI